MNQLITHERAARPLRSPFHLPLEVSERRLLLRVIDALLVIGGILGALLIWLWLGGFALSYAVLEDQSSWMILIALGWLLWLPLTDMYNLRLSARLGSSVRRILVGGLVLMAAYIVLFFITSRAAALAVLPSFGDAQASPPLRLAPVLAVTGTTILLLTWRVVYVWALGGPLARRRALILGAGSAGRAIHHTIAKSHGSHYEIVGFVDDDPAKQDEAIGNLQVLGGHDQLLPILAEQPVDEIIVAISAELPDSLFQALLTCHENGIAITPMPLLYEQLTGRIHVGHVGTQWYAALPLQPRSTATAFRFLQRVGDLAVGLALGAVLLVLLPILAIAIRLDSPGPIFYAQERLGQHGRRFRVYKLRSMVADAEADGQARWATVYDERVTRVGRVLRKLRLDELPQALNVIRGDMSVVGPRPERPEFIDELQVAIPFYRTRLAAKPGLTGWAQINYPYGNTVDDALMKLQYDLYYLKHQSPWFDLLIVLRTIPVVLRMQGT